MMAQSEEVAFVEPNFVYTVDDEMAAPKELSAITLSGLSDSIS